MVLIFKIIQSISSSKTFTPRVPENLWIWILWCRRFPPRDCCSRALEARGNILHHFAGWLTAKSWSCIHEFTGSPSWPDPSRLENSSSNGWKSETELPRTPGFPMVSLLLRWLKCGQSTFDMTECPGRARDPQSGGFIACSCLSIATAVILGWLSSNLLLFWLESVTNALR